jgi:hypothetical protein
MLIITFMSGCKLSPSCTLKGFSYICIVASLRASELLVRTFFSTVIAQKLTGGFDGVWYWVCNLLRVTSMKIKLVRNYLSLYKLRYLNCSLEQGREATRVGCEYIVCSSNERGGHQTNARLSTSPPLTVSVLSCIPHLSHAKVQPAPKQTQPIHCRSA